MNQVQIERFGPPEVLEFVSRPTRDPEAGQALIGVRAAGVTFVETSLRAGRSPTGRLPDLPWVPGNSVEGTLLAVGGDVDDQLVGRLVAAATGGSGGYADHAVVPVEAIHEVPDSLEAGAAVAMLADGRTALALVEVAEVDAGDTVLVLAAAGGVGHLLTQVAAQAGAYVAGAVGGQDKVEFVHGYGAAALAVDYSKPDWTNELSLALGGRAINVVFDGVGGELGNAAAEMIASGGRLVVFGAASGHVAALEQSRDTGIDIVPGWSVLRDPAHRRSLVSAALDAAAEDRLRPIIGQRFALSDAPEAHATIEARRTVGKSVLTA